MNPKTLAALILTLLCAASCATLRLLPLPHLLHTWAIITNSF
jgi:hypothetical protein